MNRTCGLLAAAGIAAATGAVLVSCSAWPYLAVPAFFPLNANDPTTGNTYWSELNPNPKHQFMIVVAECTFPDLTGNSLTAAQQAFQQVRANGGNVFGYVATGFGTAPLDGQDLPCPQKAGDPLGSPLKRIQHWYAAYPGLIDGIFFDEGPTYDSGIVAATPGIPTTEAGFQTYYNSLFAQYKNNSDLTGKKTVFVNASQYPFQWVVDGTAYTIQNPLTVGQGGPAAAADYAVVFEQSWANYQDMTKFVAEFPPNTPGPATTPAWWTDGNLSHKTANVIFNVSQADLSTAETIAQQRKTGLVYFLDCAPNDVTCQQQGGYGRLPTYWSSEYNYYGFVAPSSGAPRSAIAMNAPSARLTVSGYFVDAP